MNPTRALQLLATAAFAVFAPSAVAQTDDPAAASIIRKLDEAAEKQSQILELSKSTAAKIAEIAAKPTPGGGSEAAELAEKVAALEARLAALEPAQRTSEEPTGKAATPGIQDNVNLVWTIVAGALVFLMQAGFCCLELGLARAKNSINICMKNFLDFCVASVCFLFIGFPLMFGTSVGGVIGAGNMWLSSFGAAEPFWAFWFFQTVFAGTAATIVSGAVAERRSLSVTSRTQWRWPHLSTRFSGTGRGAASGPRSGMVATKVGWRRSALWILRARPWSTGWAARARSRGSWSWERARAGFRKPGLPG